MEDKSKKVGVSKVGRKWRSVVRWNNVKYNIGYFDTEEAAVNARLVKLRSLGVEMGVDFLEGEEWRVSPSLGYPYYVSNMGRVKSVDFNQMGFERLMKPTITQDGRYLGIVRPWNSFRIHRLVMEAFVGPSDLQVNHIDNNPLNNRLDNLEYVTNRENSCHWRGGAMGCTFFNNKWMAVVKINGRSRTLGYYDTYEEAHQRYILALRENGIENKYVKI